MAEERPSPPPSVVSEVSTSSSSAPELSENGTYPKEVRVRRKSDYNEIHRKGVRVRSADFQIVALFRPQRGFARFGMAVSKKVGGAVIRNRLRRLFRECFRLSRHSFPSVDLVVIPRPEARRFADGKLDALYAELGPLMVKACAQAQKGGKPRRSRPPKRRVR